MRTLSLSIAIGAAAIAALVRLTVFAQPRPDVKVDAKNVELVSHFDLGWYMPATPPGNTVGTAQINHAIVDERGLIYANDRMTGGLYILKYTGSIPLN